VEDGSEHLVGMALQAQEADFRLDVPDLDEGVGPGGTQGTTIRSEGDRQDRPLVARERADQAVGLGLPEPDLVPLVGAGEQPAAGISSATSAGACSCKSGPIPAVAGYRLAPRSASGKLAGCSRGAVLPSPPAPVG
jgi:hypothetical protein